MVNRKITVDREGVFQQALYSRQLPNLIKGIVNRKIIESKAKEEGLEVGVEELQEAADNFRSAHKLHKTEETWSWLQNHYMSLDDFEASLKTRLLSRKLARHMFSDRVESYFYEHQLDYEKVVLYEVVLKDEDLAVELFFALQEGECAFQDVARQHINVPKLRRSGGYLGVMRRKDLMPEIAASAFASTPPQVLKPITTSKGAHLVLVEEIIKPQLSDEKVRSQILTDLFSAWLMNQVKRVEIITEFAVEASLPSPNGMWPVEMGNGM